MSDIDISDEACAVVCMLVSNPGDSLRPLGWQRRVNDLIRALRDERNQMREQSAKLVEALMDNKPYSDWPNARVALAVAAMAIRRGRHLTESEKLENLAEAFAGDGDLATASKIRALKQAEPRG